MRNTNIKVDLKNENKKKNWTKTGISWQKSDIFSKGFLRGISKLSGSKMVAAARWLAPRLAPAQTSVERVEIWKRAR